MKKIVVISSYCDTQEKKNTLVKNIEILKKHNLDILVISPINIDVNCDFLFLTKENPILGPDKKAWSYWKIFNNDGRQIKVNQHMLDYGWASLYQIKKVCQIALTFNYDLYYLMIYDLIITQEIIDEILLNKVNLLYPRKNHNTNDVFPATFHFSIFDNKTLEKITNKIDYNDYCNNNGFAENFIEKWCNELSISKSNLIVEDSINNNSELTLFNYSFKNEYKFFIGENKSKKVLFYFYDLLCDIKVTINGIEYYIDKNNELIISELLFNQIYEFIIFSENSNIDYIEIVDKIIWNEIEVLN